MKISFSLRAFVVYFLILGSLLWFTLDNAIERLNDGMRQSAESVMVDIAHIMASLIENEIAHQETSPSPSTNSISTLFKDIKQRSLSARIYQVIKTEVDTDVYVTDHKGIVIYDSTGQAVGEDYSQWRDVRLTLEGEYGARTSFKDQNKTEPDDEKIMVVAAPLMQKKNNDDQIVGVVSVVKSITSLEGYLVTDSNQLKRYAVMLLLLALIVGYLISMWFTASLRKISNYADEMAAGKSAEVPQFMDKRFNQLASSLTHMREQLDGKEYVEDYIHSLTHELKTPITSIRGAVELLNSNMPVEDRSKFLSNIDISNQRMSRLVDKMLSLAKLEGLTELQDPSEFDFQPTLQRLLLERDPIIQKKGITVITPKQTSQIIYGEKLLISQAVANLLDNAIDFCNENGKIEVAINTDQQQHSISIINQGEPIPDFALQRMYDRFFSLPRPNTENSQLKSTGLGLSFVKEIMKLHQGTVSIYNNEDGVKAELNWNGI